MVSSKSEFQSIELSCRTQAEGLDKAIVDRLTARLIEQASECETALEGK
jgi:hypothetical protein